MTRRIAIDFAPASFTRSWAATSVATWLIGAGALVLCAAAASTILELRAQAAQREAAIAIEERTARTARQARKPAPVVAVPETQVRAVNQAIAQLNLPWRDVFDAVEAATSNQVALLALEPDARKRVLRGTAESRSHEGMIAYIEDMKRQPFFGTVILTRHEVNEQDPNKPLRFHFEAQWLEGSL